MNMSLYNIHLTGNLNINVNVHIKILQGVSNKAHHKVLCSFCLTFPATHMLEGSYILHLKGLIQSIVCSKKIIQYDISKPKRKQNYVNGISDLKNFEQ